MRTEIKQKLHTGHMGINSCLRRARELVFWPGMSHEIRHFVEPCDICATYSDKQAPESLYLHAVPSRPCEKLGTDLFTIEDRTYLVTTDYYSNFFEVDFLPELTSGTVVTKLKYHFARHGIPDTLISDGGPQYSSAVFKLFSDKWGFTHDMSSPGNSKANGAAEAAVKIAKRLMKRSIVAKEDPYIGLLNHRNTPTEGLTTSPAQRLLGRHTKTLVPTTTDRLKPSNHDSEYVKTCLEDKRATVANRQSNRHRHDLQPLKMGDVVRVQPIERGKKEWRQATVTKRLKTRTYEVTADNGRRYRRNRQFLRSSRKSRVPQPSLPAQSVPPVASRHTAPMLAPISIDQNVTEAWQQTNLTPSGVPECASPYKTRSGRVIKSVDKLNL